MEQILIPADDFRRDEEEKESPVVIDDQYSGGESDSDSEEADSKKSESKTAPVAPLRQGQFGNSTKNASVAAAAANLAGNAGLIKQRVSLTSVVAALKRFMAPREMKIMVALLMEFRAKKFGVEELKRKARLIAGDKLILAVKMAAGVPVNTGRAAPAPLAPPARGGLRIVNSNVRDIYLPALIMVLAEFLPASKIETLCKSVGDFREKKMTRGELAGSVRRIVGDDNALIAAINSYRNRKQKLQQQQPAK